MATASFGHYDKPKQQPAYGEQYTPYKNRKNFALKRQKRELIRAAVDVETLDTVFGGMIRQYKYREQKVKAALHKYGKDPEKSAFAKARLTEFAQCKEDLTKLHGRIRRPLVGIIESRNRIFKDATPEERAERTAALLKIPPSEFTGFDALSPDQQDAELLRLVDLHGAGSKNGGYSDSLLNMPGLVNPHTTGKHKDIDGKRRRTLLQWEMIDRLIYAALNPSKYQHIFFHQTDKNVHRWGKNRRQMRSEGRLAMVRVLIVLILRLDINKSLRSGVYNPETDMFEGIPRAKIAEWAGISTHAVKDVLENLVKLHILYPGKQPRESYPGTGADDPIKYKGLPVVRRFTLLLIAGLSLEHLHKTATVDPKKDLDDAQLAELRDMELMGEELGIDVSGEIAKAEAMFTIKNYTK